MRERGNWNRGNRRGGGFRGGRGRGGRGFGPSPWRGPPLPMSPMGPGSPMGPPGMALGPNWGPPNRGNFRGHRGSRPPRPYGDYGNKNDNQWNNRPKREMPGKRLSEEEIGVTEYMSDHEGFIGIIKSRYSDFQVSEINEQGEVAQVTDLSAPKHPVDETTDNDEDLVLNKYNLEILPMDTWDRINALIGSKDNTQTVEVDVTGMTKEQRTKIHESVKKAFEEKIVGSTVSEGDKKLVRFVKYRKGVRIDNRVKWVWPGEYVYFIVNKENCDTMDVAVRIAERLRLNIKPSLMGYAGTKDRRAKTSQWFSLRKVDPRRIATSCAYMKDVLVGNFSFADTNLRLGMLKGNRFRIALRNVTVSDECVSAACELLKEKGFINYYGLQRFGTRADNPTYTTGLKMLQGKFKEAIASILEEREGPIQKALRIYAERGPAAAIRALPSYAPNCNIEVRLLKALANRPNDLLGALSTMTRNTRLLYLHAYQSLVWNRAASQRVKTAGLVPVVGDLVPLADVGDEEYSDDESDEDDTDNESEKAKQPSPPGDDENKMADTDEHKMADTDEHKMADSSDSKLNPSLESSIKEKQAIQVKVLTQEDIDSGDYTIFDVVLPLPGYNIRYPPNLIDYYEELLTKDGLTMDMKHKFKNYNMSGAYRHLAVRPSDVEWRCVRYDDPFADLIPSDRDLLEGKEMNGVVEDGKYKALILNMTLASSCYATMALRELLKVDTSCDNQALQNNYHKEKTDPKTEAPKDDEDKTEETEDSKIEEEQSIMEECEKEVKCEKRPLESEEEVEVKKLKTE